MNKNKITAIGNLKGGVGKSTTATALAQAAAFKGRRVLLVDLDPQANGTFIVGGDSTLKGTAEFLNGAPVEDVVQHQGLPGIDVIGGSWDLAGLSSDIGALRMRLDPVKERYDDILLDCPPSTGMLLLNALVAADRVVVPLQADVFAIQSLRQIVEVIDEVRQYNAALSVAGIVFTRDNPRSVIARQMKELVSNQVASLSLVVLGSVREAVALREAQTLQANLYEYAPKSFPARDYLAIYKALNEQP